MSVHNPHDRFFRDSFTRPEIVRDYLQEYLPPDVNALLDLDTLTLQDGSFIDEAMQEHQTDLLYQVRLGGGESAYIYFLFEHKSYPDPLVPLQLLRYLVRFWERQLKENEALAPVIPLVIYHGEKPWQVPTEFLSLVEAPAELRRYLPEFQYHLSDFSHLSDEEIRGQIWLRACLSVMRAIFDPGLRQELPDLIDLVLQLRQQQRGVDYVRTVLYYLTRATERISRQDWEQALLQQGREGERLMPTIAQEYIREGLERGREEGREEGLERGREEGREEGKVEAARQYITELLQLRLGVPPSQYSGQLEQINDPEQLQLLVHKAALAADVAEFEEALASVRSDAA